MDLDHQLEKIHQLELKIAIEVKRICEKYDIKYFLIGGTLLGAVRHGGFIPWDDDMDIGMKREEYNRFVKVCNRELGDAFYLQTWDTDMQYPFSFAKVRLKGTRVVEEFSEVGGMENGIFIDIFPFDAVPDNEKERKKQGKKYFICKRLLWIKKGMGTNMKTSAKSAVKYYAFLLFSKLFPYEAVKNYFRKTQQKYNHLHTRKVVADGAYTYERESIERKWVEKLEPVKFETEYFPAFQEKKSYLEHLYGDYMQLPPVEERRGHGLVKVDFGAYGD